MIPSTTLRSCDGHHRAFCLCGTTDLPLVFIPAAGAEPLDVFQNGLSERSRGTRSKSLPFYESGTRSTVKEIVDDSSDSWSDMSIGCATVLESISYSASPGDVRSLPVIRVDGNAFFGIFDGRGPAGHFISRYCKQRFSEKLIVNGPARMMMLQNSSEGLKQIFRSVDSELKNMDDLGVKCSGTTAMLLHVCGRLITCAWVGDTRVVIGRENHSGHIIALPLTVDHTPDQPAERRRMLTYRRVSKLESRCAAKGESPTSSDIGQQSKTPYQPWNKGQFAPSPSVSRSLGDSIAHEVDGVFPEPDIRMHETIDRDRFIIVATSDVWKHISNDEAVQIVSSCSSPRDAASNLGTEAYVRQGRNGEVGASSRIAVVVAALVRIDRDSFEQVNDTPMSKCRC